MFANVDLKIDGGEGLRVPVDAVLPTGSRWQKIKLKVLLDRPSRFEAPFVS
jgi:hypothetical protein